ncbi:MAG: molybdenum cofactor guanylyltransferase [Phycisphaerales bacterium]|nr:molybdenum cofactor guanylyltransferase [Phycisphaerales bacterium]
MIAPSIIPPPRAWDFCGAVLSGGESQRMGVPKAGLLLPDGRSMIERARDTLEVFCRQVILVGDAYGIFGHEVVKDAQTGIGPLGGIESLLASNLDTQYLVIPCDLPLAPPGFLGRLTREDNIDGMTVFQVEGEDRPRPLPCRIGGDCLDDVRELIADGEHSIASLIKRLGPDVEISPVASREKDLLMNVNTPEDFERACSALRKP